MVQHKTLPPSSKSFKPPKSSAAATSSKKTPTTSSADADADVPVTAPKTEVSPQELKHQQTLLNIFIDTFSSVFRADDFASVLQEVKQALYNREFAKAFGKEGYLDVYAARWSPTRALCYARVLGEIEEHLREEGKGSEGGGNEVERRNKQSPLKVLAIGGGAAEIVSFASFLSRNEEFSGDLTLLDTGPWKGVIDKLSTTLRTPPQLSKYASATAKATNAALTPESRLRWTFAQQDILDLTKEQLAEVLGTDALLVTLLFTLNELYTSGGIAKTTSFLRTLTTSIPINSLLLVVDSPGSYSEASIGKEARKYPMQWLLNHTLLNDSKLPTDGCKWEKLESHDSIWFRVAELLRYPVALENMRYQMHLYRAVARPQA
ncbi:uncharacterized protein BCR38DRAFT_334501 [Pseudomassariella vexata]|uniref:25S rRNA (Uridine(2843)-N(3))-methyltransferase n=1 Tax=Pseudomassariella vexata TaxID=1141098 RepID=A0A1Y2EBM1_9PEZI|nr:uncharacterized protein BCR38DRAFT_334501 [Pseudomassariella vexata]ORY68704.1 hypothetical protein BCR38DRAFT_334501 [Pseudomassariella vexata]